MCTAECKLNYYKKKLQVQTDYINKCNQFPEAKDRTKCFKYVNNNAIAATKRNIRKWEDNIKLIKSYK